MVYIDALLNKITMYRLVMYGLALLALLAVVGGFVGKLPHSGIEYLASFFLLVCVCYVADVACATLYRAPVNSESSYITAFILFFLLEPSLSFLGLAWIAAGGLIAILSKYVLAFNNKHLFNPAAVSALILSLAGSGVVFWWVATPLLLGPVALLGLLVVHKIRRFDVFLPFVVASVVVGAGYAVFNQYDAVGFLRQLVLSWPLIFFGTIMLTEPATTPPTRTLRIVYGVIVGALFSAQFSIGHLSATPQFALVVGNLFAYLVSPKWKLLLTLQSVKDMGSGFYEFVFIPDRTFTFLPGQYLEWTLSPEGADIRGNRRYLSISSAPGGLDVRCATRMPRERPSSFKSKLLALRPGDRVTAGGLAGDFTLPEKTETKLAFIAGGIGITPFISQLRDCIRRGEKRDIVLMYAAHAQSDFVYGDVLKDAQALGVRVVYVAGAFITKDMLEKEVPDYRERLFYISGPNAMVETYRTLLRTLGLSRSRITTDYFPGL